MSFVIVASILAGTAGAQPLTAPAAVPTVASMLPALDQLAGESITTATGNPDTPYAPPPTQHPLVGTDGSEGSLETTTRLAGGQLASEVIVSFGGTRGVATVKAGICPDETGKVEGTIRLIIVGADQEEHRSFAIASGSVNDQASLTSSSVDFGTTKGHKATLLMKYGKQLLKTAESAWRQGYCVKIDVSEGQSGVVQPSAKVPIAATAKPRFRGGGIKGPMTARKTAGQQKVQPGSSRESPAKFVYFAPTSKPGTGSVELQSVSRRGIGIGHLEYTTEGDYKIEGDEPFGGHMTAIKCHGFTGTWDATFSGGYVGMVSFAVPTEPAPGAPVNVTTPQYRHYNANGETIGEVDQRLILTFYADGAEADPPAPAGAPALGIYVGNPGAVVLPIQVGQFCK